jgi:L-ascorbate metabolism protein UlaG (beta-lactamase superfamily)
MVKPGELLKLNEALKIHVLPSYNTKNQSKTLADVSYAIQTIDAIFYHASDSDRIPEQKKIVQISQKGYFMTAFISVSSQYALSPKQAIDLARFLQADIVVPIHWGLIESNQQAKEFFQLCQKESIVCQIPAVQTSSKIER